MTLPFSQSDPEVYQRVPGNGSKHMPDGWQPGSLQLCSYPEKPVMDVREKPDPEMHFLQGAISLILLSACMMMIILNAGLKVNMCRWELVFPNDPEVLEALKCCTHGCIKEVMPFLYSLNALLSAMWH